MTDYIDKMLARLRELDPDYGIWAHQRDYITRCREMQRIQPCSKDHDLDDPPEHRYSGTNACYSEATRVQVARMKLDKNGA